MHKHVSALFVLVAALVLVGVFATPAPQSAVSATQIPFAGWAWSSNVGWLSFNCSNDASCSSSTYAVRVDSDTGELSGWAWGSFGWVSFNRGEISGCPSSDPEVVPIVADGCAARMVPPPKDPPQAGNIRRIVGWARVCSGTGTPSSCSGAGLDDGFLGYISLSPKAGEPAINTAANCRTTTALMPAGCYGIRLNTTSNVMSGFGWGGEVIGWMNFAPVTDGGTQLSPVVMQTPPAAITSFTATPTVVGEGGGNTTIMWCSTDATTCDRTSSPSNGSWNMVGGAGSGSISVPVSVNTTFTITCHGSGADAVSNLTVSVGAAAGQFSLRAVPSSFNVSFVSDKAETTTIPVKISVIAGAGFVAPVSITVDSLNLPKVAAGGGNTSPTARFDTRTSATTNKSLSQAQYNSGSDLYLSIPSAVVGGTYTVNIRGTAAGAPDFVLPVTIKVQSFTPSFQEQ